MGHAHATGAREAAFAIVVALFTLASYRSVDPVSRKVYGTFDTGVRRMYRMSSITREFEGPGRELLQPLGLQGPPRRAGRRLDEDRRLRTHETLDEEPGLRRWFNQPANTVLLANGLALAAQVGPVPADNPLSRYRLGWTDAIRWSSAVSIADFKGNSVQEKLKAAQAMLAS